MKLAIVSPLPPASTGIADYTMDVVRALTPAHHIELYHDQPGVSASPAAPVFRIDELPVRAVSRPYDAVIYQMGNAPAHDFMYEWMERVPGAVVLHDLVLHHSYARRYLESPESLRYAADPSSNEKRIEAEAKHHAYEVGIDRVHSGLGARLKDAHLNSAGDLLPYAFPLFEPALAGARAAGAHNSFMVNAIQRARPDLACVQLAMPVLPVTPTKEAMTAVRSRFQLLEKDLLVGCFGLMTREKRIETAARAIARIAQIHPDVRFLLAGPTPDPSWLGALLDRTGVSARTVVTGRLEPEDFTAAMALTRAVVHLRYPTARETSAALLRVMAQGRPIIISDLLNQKEIPPDAVLRVDPCDEEGDLTRAIDVILRDPGAAEAMGQRGRRFAVAAHSASRTRESYERLLQSVAPHYSGPQS